MEFGVNNLKRKKTKKCGVHTTQNGFQGFITCALGMRHCVSPSITFYVCHYLPLYLYRRIASLLDRTIFLFMGVSISFTFFPPLSHSF